MLAEDRYRNLGHAVTRGFLVSRLGSVVRRRYALSTDGIVGWTFRRSLFQRRDVVRVHDREPEVRGGEPLADAVAEHRLDVLADEIHPLGHRVGLAVRFPHHTGDLGDERVEPPPLGFAFSRQAGPLRLRSLALAAAGGRAGDVVHQDPAFPTRS